MKTIHPRDFDKYTWAYKYVRFNDNTILFCDAGDSDSSHQQIINARGNPAKGLPISAGTIKMVNGKWNVIQHGSTTAKLTYLAGDNAALNRLLIEFGLEYDETIR